MATAITICNATTNTMRFNPKSLTVESCPIVSATVTRPVGSEIPLAGSLSKFIREGLTKYASEESVKIPNVIKLTE